MKVTQAEERTRRLILRPLKESDYKVWFEAHVNRLEAAINLESGWIT